MTQRTPRASRMSVITDWRVRNESELHDVLPGDSTERVIAPQKFVVLRRVVVRDLSLVRLQIGEVDVPFERWGPSVVSRTYSPKSLNDVVLMKRLVAIGAAVATPDSIAIAPGLEIRMHLCNETGAPAKPRAALLVQEETS